jgi:ribonuclease P protein component
MISDSPGASGPPGIQRIKTRSQFQAVMSGQTVSRTAHFALHRVTLFPPAFAADAFAGPGSSRPQALFAVQAPWIGAVIPKRWAKRAVTRNTIKRQIYCVVLDFAASLPTAAHVVRLRSTFDRAQFVSATSDALKRAVRAELQALFGGVRR